MTFVETPMDAAAKAAQLLREHRESIDRLDAILVFTLAGLCAFAFVVVYVGSGWFFPDWQWDVTETGWSAFFTPLPFVKRVVFIATPHRGSSAADMLFRDIGPDLLPRLYKLLSRLKISSGAFSQRPKIVLPSSLIVAVKRCANGSPSRQSLHRQSPMLIS